MRKLTFDQYEFDTPSSEESLEIMIASPRQFNEFAAFLKACPTSRTHGSPLPKGWQKWFQVAEKMDRFAHVQLPRLEQCREAVVFIDDWNEVEVAAAAGPSLFWYHWLTSA